uniref:ATP-dependent RNA helicase n=1 Tax=Dermatophagoides pteronyssinus TaxID=6956 RepID=A0A6P6Y8P6_DERPT|nr:ATP-dependent RNA helicase HAS1-like [Dermatophagoides pteronyssinus]
MSNSILTSQSFSELEGVSEKLKSNLAANAFAKMTHIQATVIPALLQGRDVIGAARTGSGKTIAYLVPIVSLLYNLRVKPSFGTVALVIAPTRELALQIFDVAKLLTQNFTFRLGCIIGGNKRSVELDNLKKGVVLLIATPGRLLDHLEHSKGFEIQQLKFLVIDEADRVFSCGFEKDLKQILDKLPKDRQTALFSATITESISKLALSTMRNPLFIDVKPEQGSLALPQYYTVCSGFAKLATLFKILKEKSKDFCENEAKSSMKIMIFISTCQSVQFHEMLFRLFGKLLPIFSLHGDKKQAKRTEIFHAFSKARNGILFCTNVAARGLDIPAVNLIVQYDPPEQIANYVHRIGRTARGVNATGTALLFLAPNETLFVHELKQLSYELTHLKSKQSSLDKIAQQIVKLIAATPELTQQAALAFRKYILAYQSHDQKEIFDVSKLNISEIAHSFGLSEPIFSVARAHPAKNRYANIAPFDTNRVVINKGDGYINASWMDPLANGHRQWDDFNVPSMKLMQEFIDELMAEHSNLFYSNDEGNIFIHCSGGIGRTGTLITALCAFKLKEHANEKLLVDVLTRLKNQRVGSVGYRVQFEFLHAYLKQLLGANEAA